MSRIGVPFLFLIILGGSGLLINDPIVVGCAVIVFLVLLIGPSTGIGFTELSGRAFKFCLICIILGVIAAAIYSGLAQ